MFFPEYGSNYSFATFEEKVLAFWKQQDVFQRSLEKAKDRQTFFFYDGPPFATGLPHYGHILAGTIKDIVPRYWSLRGRHVPRRFGWDCHGLPVEFEVEKKEGLNGSLDIQAYGVAKFNEVCRSIVLRHTEDWRKTVERMGRWVDMDNDYKTMDPSFMESVWWVFKELWKKGLVYQGKKVVPYSWRLTSPLSNFEASLNYKDVQDPALTVLMPLKSDKFPKTGILIWTTTPWTLPSNLGVAIHTDAKVVSYGIYKLETPAAACEQVIVANSRAEALGFKEKLSDVTSAELLGTAYEPLFSCFVNHKNAFRVLDGSAFVSADDGTGVVHMAPAFGEDDFYVCQKAGIELVDPTDAECKFTSEIATDARLKDCVGLFVKDADKNISKLIKESGRLLKQETLQHAYPYCYRSDTPLIYKAIPSWYVAVEKVKPYMLAANQEIHWVPDHIQNGRFGKWLENARDWCISRNRFWGTPIPVWLPVDGVGEPVVIGSQKELEDFAGKPMPDLHKHFVDEVVFQKDGKTYKRTLEVLDCWFESGSMPYAQAHYPFENKAAFEAGFPADFIAEGLDQTRGWFYTLTVLASTLFKKPAFKNCIVNGMVLAEDGKKMSKSLKNYPDPAVVFDKYGADALRLYLMQSPAMRAEELRFSERGLLELMRAVMLPLWNSYSFFASYANIDQWTARNLKEAPPEKDRTVLDRWILARVRETEAQIHKQMEAYKLYEVAPLLISLIDDLTNWYIRLNRDRFWGAAGGENQKDKNAAYATLWSVLDRLSLLMASGLPFISETLNAALRGVSLDQVAGDKNYESVHERLFGDGTALSKQDQDLLGEVYLAKRVILLGRSLRGEAKIGLRQPLPHLRVAGLSAQESTYLEKAKSLILDEVNVKSLELVAKASDLVEESAKPNFKTVGKKAGPKMKEIQALLAQWTHKEIATFEAEQKATVGGVELAFEDIQIARKAKEGRLALADRGLVAELDTTLTPELVNEGIKREVINRIQQRRKDMKLHLADRIHVSWKVIAGDTLKKVLNEESARKDYIALECLVLNFEENTALVGEEISLDEQGSFSFEIKKS